MEKVGESADKLLAVARYAGIFNGVESSFLDCARSPQHVWLISLDQRQEDVSNRDDRSCDFLWFGLRAMFDPVPAGQGSLPWLGSR